MAICRFRTRYYRSTMINPFRKLLRLSRIPLPPQQLIDGVGGGDFNAIGKEFFAYFTDLCGLGRGDYVLDVGCGCGRMAVPLVAYLNNRAKYEGFDISEPAFVGVKRTSAHVIQTF